MRKGDDRMIMECERSRFRTSIGYTWVNLNNNNNYNSKLAMINLLYEGKYKNSPYHVQKAE